MTEIQSSKEKPDETPASPARTPSATDDGWQPWGTSEKQKFGQADGSERTQQF